MARHRLPFGAEGARRAAAEGGADPAVLAGPCPPGSRGRMPCVTLGVLGRRISLASLRSAPTRAAPEHRVALMEEAKRVSQKVAAQHRRPPYADRPRPALSLSRQQPVALNKETWHDHHRRARCRHDQGPRPAGPAAVRSGSAPEPAATARAPDRAAPCSRRGWSAPRAQQAVRPPWPNNASTTRSNRSLTRSKKPARRAATDSNRPWAAVPGAPDASAVPCVSPRGSPGPRALRTAATRRRTDPAGPTAHRAPPHDQR